jgi:hypothetical protein
MTRTPHAAIALTALLATAPPASAHSGPPFPIVTDAVHGRYTVSIWTDPDATDDATLGGQFWVVFGQRAGAAPIPKDTRVTVTVQKLLGRSRESGPMLGLPISTVATPVRDDVTNQFAAVRLDSEQRFNVRVIIDGPLGPATIDSIVDATYDLRPPASMLIVYAVPFLLAGLLWTRLLIWRRALTRKR